MSEGERTGTVARAVDVLRAVAESEKPVLPASTVHRMVRLLQAQGMVRLDPTIKLYGPGEDLVRISYLVSARSSVVDVARPMLEEVVAGCGETVQLSQYLPDHRAMMVVDQVRCAHPLQFALPLYERQSLLWGCSGQVILAHLPDDVVDTVLAESAPSTVTGAAPPSRAELDERLARIRDRGWGRTEGEKLAHAVGFAAPVFARDGVYGSVHVPVPTARYTEDVDGRVVELLTSCARRLSRALGG